ncbi:MAG: ABC transporter substrate-binding protein [Clostridioides sp.]|jgi:NitT/TauT family transport system substrate-binding protein|nr:ABC transporter substrate-binding protein [Clostridioides sp.]
MKKKIIALITSMYMLFSLVGCQQSKTDDTAKKEDGAIEVSNIRWNSGTSGNVLLTIAEEKGYFKEAGITIENVQANANADAMTMLATGKVDIVSNSGTSNPLQQIASGVDLTIFGGHMVTGAMPIIAKSGTKWNGVQDLVGKKIACNPSYFAITGAVKDLGYDNPLDAVEFVSYTDYNDALAAVVRGEVDYALMGTGQNSIVKSMDDVDIMCYQSDIMPNYSCCRMEAQTDFVEKNPNTIKAIIKVLLRAQAYYEGHKDEAVKLHAAKIGAEEDYVAAYMLDDEHYQVSVDPLKNSVVRAWNILDETGFLDEKAKNIKIEEHINTTLYEEALKEATAQYGSENPDFYKKMQTFFNENDVQ